MAQASVTPPAELLVAAVRVARHRSITRAAEELGLSQSALSRQIQTLERLLGTRLFDRLGRSVRPTAAGEELISRAAPLLEELSRLLAHLTVGDGQAGSRVRLGASEILAVHVLPALVASLRKARKADLALSCHPGDHLPQLVLSGELDIAVCALEADPPGLTSTPLWEEDLVLVLPAGHAARSRSLASYRGEPFVLPAAVSVSRRLLDRALADRNVELRIVAEHPSAEVVKALVRAGIGLAILPEPAVRAETRAGSLAAWPLADLPLRRRIHTLTDPRRAPWPAELAVLDALQRYGR